MEQLVLTQRRLPLLLVAICSLEILIYVWAFWTSTLDKGTFWGMEPQFIFDKCARNAGRLSSALILATLLMVGYYGLKKIYGDERKKETFLVLITLFSFNHLIHLLFVLLRFQSHGESIDFEETVKIGGTMHGVSTFALIVLMPFVLWSFKRLNTVLYIAIIFHLFNICLFINRTFWGKIKPPDHPAYHNQLGILLLTVACVYILYRVVAENMSKTQNS